ncbi:hypothetical protein GVAV_003154 [Gurleya vavrai]
MKTVLKIQSQKEFDELLETLDTKIVLKFSSHNCPPCKELNKTIKNYNTENEIKIIEILVDDVPELGKKFDVHATPTCLVIDSQGNEIARKVGYMKLPTFENFLEEKFFKEIVEKIDENHNKNL